MSSSKLCELTVLTRHPNVSAVLTSTLQSLRRSLSNILFIKHASVKRSQIHIPMATNHMNGVIYIRVSTKEQVEGTSLTTQRDACLQYAATHKITIEKVFEEQGESAKFRDRTQLLALIDFCRTRKSIQALIVWKLDRFARNVL